MNIEKIIHEVYKNPDLAELLLFKTNGSKYNNLAEIITQFFTKNVLKVIKKMLDKGILDHDFVINQHQINFFVYSNSATFYDILKHNFSETDTVILYKKLCQFNFYEWINFLNI